jgi:hypothetical protein
MIEYGVETPDFPFQKIYVGKLKETEAYIFVRF